MKATRPRATLDDSSASGAWGSAVAAKSAADSLLYLPLSGDRFRLERTAKGLLIFDDTFMFAPQMMLYMRAMLMSDSRFLTQL